MSILPSSPPFPSPHGESGSGSPTYSQLIAPLEAQLPYLPPLVSGSNRPLDFTFDFQVRALVYYHTEAFTSAQDLLQAAHDDPWVNHLIVPATGLGESTFYEANANRGSQQLLVLVDRLSKKVRKQLKVAHLALGELVALDGSLIAASLSMRWAEYSSSQHKAKAHVGFDLNRGLPRQLALTEGNGAERPFVSTFLAPGETVVVDRGYLDYHLFDTWIDQGKHFVARIRKNAQREILEALPLPPDTNLFFFAKVRLGDAAHCMKHPLFLIGFKNRGNLYWIVTDREDLSAEQIAFIFALRWEIESFFAWWKKHLDVYHLISRNAPRRVPPVIGRAGDLLAVAPLLPAVLWRTTFPPTPPTAATADSTRSHHRLSDRSYQRYRACPGLAELGLVLPKPSKSLTGNCWLLPASEPCRHRKEMSLRQVNRSGAGAGQAGGRG